jgi:coproporphyrinogen III oxidase-like Fe-S oxidoreductase
MEVEEPLTPSTRATEALLMGLRLAEGVDLDRITQLNAGVVPVDLAAVARLEDLGLVARSPGRLRVTEAGALLLDAILPEIVTA